jgi:hypothetical protein
VTKACFQVHRSSLPFSNLRVIASWPGVHKNKGDLSTASMMAGYQPDLRERENKGLLSRKMAISEPKTVLATSRAVWGSGNTSSGLQSGVGWWEMALLSEKKRVPSNRCMGIMNGIMN